MHDGEHHGRRRWWLLAGLALLLVIAAVVVLRTVVFRDRARAVSTDEAVDRYRTQASSVPVESTASPSTVGVLAPPTPPPTVTAFASVAPTSPSSTASTSTVPSQPVALVEPGVYRYTTTGQEHVDALDGTTHTYSSETTITVVPDGCGVSLRWDALEERWDQWRLCATPDGVVLQTDAVQFHEFFGQPDDEAVACDVSVLFVPVVPSAPPPVQQSCTLADDPWLPQWTTLERTSRTIDGELIDVRHVRMTIEDSDEYWEHTTLDWYLAPNGLPVEMAETKSSLSPSPIGDIQYDEQYHLQVVSLTPLR